MTTMFLFANSTDLKIIGASDFQIQEIPQSDYYDKKSVRWTDFSNPIDYTPHLNSFLINYKSKLTDMLGILNGAFLISEKLLDIFLKANIEQYQYFVANVVYRKQNYKYYYFFIYGQNFDYVDYRNMVFIGESAQLVENNENGQGQWIFQNKEIEVEGEEQIINWQQFYPNYPRWNYKNLKLNYANIKTDMIRIPTVFNNLYFVSDKLKTQIEQAGCTGMQFRTSDIFNREIL